MLDFIMQDWILDLGWIVTKIIVVIGPLLATLIADLVSEQFPGKSLTRFEFKAMNPVFDLNAFHVCGINPNQNGQLELWIKDHADVLCMKASATLV